MIASIDRIQSAVNLVMNANILTFRTLQRIVYLSSELTTRFLLLPLLRMNMYVNYMRHLSSLNLVFVYFSSIPILNIVEHCDHSPIRLEGVMLWHSLIFTLAQYL
jgi:hypothetical protein